MKKALLILCLTFCCSAIFAQKFENLALTPQMGWNSWNKFASNIDEATIRGIADAMVETGLRDAGYIYLNIDDGFFGGRDSNGKLLIHPTRFPNGMRTVGDYIHSKGLKAGIYSDAGKNTCASYWGGDTIGVGVGLYGHDAADLDLFFNPEKLKSNSPPVTFGWGRGYF